MAQQRLYEITRSIIDFVSIEEFFHSVGIVDDKWNPRGGNFSVTSLGNEVLENNIRTHVENSSFPESFLSHILGRLGNIKGTENGIRLALGLIGISGRVYPGWRIIELRAISASARTTDQAAYLAKFDEDFNSIPVATSDGSSLFFQGEEYSNALVANNNLRTLELRKSIQGALRNFVYIGSNIVFNAPQDAVRSELDGESVFQMSIAHMLGDSGMTYDELESQEQFTREVELTMETITRAREPLQYSGRHVYQPTHEEVSSRTVFALGKFTYSFSIQFDTPYTESNASLLLREISVNADGEIGIKTSTSGMNDPNAAGPNLSTFAKENLEFQLSQGASSATFALTGLNASEPYVFTPDNVAEITAFHANLQSALPVTLRIHDTSLIYEGDESGTSTNIMEDEFTMTSAPA